MVRSRKSNKKQFELINDDVVTPDEDVVTPDEDVVTPDEDVVTPDEVFDAFI